MATVRFFWETDDPVLDAQIVDTIVAGEQGRFIQEVVDGKVLDLPLVTDEQRKAFAIRILTERNIQAVTQSQVEQELQAFRQERFAAASQHQLPVMPKLRK